MKRGLASLGLWMVVGCTGTSESKAPEQSSLGDGAETAVAEPPPERPDSDPEAAETDTAEGTDPGAPSDTGASRDTGGLPEDTGAESGPRYHGQTLDPVLPVPAFAVSDQHGVVHGPESLQGAPTVVWFFRDTAHACTNDACGYRDLQVEFDALGVRIVAVGPTDVATNAAWAASLDYDYWIWADTESVLATAYGTESDFDEGNLRHAFLLDDEGQAFLWYEGAVSLGADPRQVLADCTALFGTPD